jgi:hypothetical protein
VISNRVKPVIAFCGYGWAGKDTAALWFAKNTTLEFSGGASWHARKYMCKRLSKDAGVKLDPDEVYARRHEDRQLWYRYLNEYRAKDPVRLIRRCIRRGDILCGVRDKEEMVGAKVKNLVDLWVWIDRKDNPVDSTVTYADDDCDIVIQNHGSLQAFYAKLYRLADVLGLIVDPALSE